MFEHFILLMAVNDISVFYLVVRLDFEALNVLLLRLINITTHKPVHNLKAFHIFYVFLIIDFFCSVSQNY